MKSRNCWSCRSLRTNARCEIRRRAEAKITAIEDKIRSLQNMRPMLLTILKRWGLPTAARSITVPKNKNLERRFPMAIPMQRPGKSWTLAPSVKS